MTRASKLVFICRLVTKSVLRLMFTSPNFQVGHSCNPQRCILHHLEGPRARLLLLGLELENSRTSDRYPGLSAHGNTKDTVQVDKADRLGIGHTGRVRVVVEADHDAIVGAGRTHPQA